MRRRNPGSLLLRCRIILGVAIPRKCIFGGTRRGRRFAIVHHQVGERLRGNEIRVSTELGWGDGAVLLVEVTVREVKGRCGVGQRLRRPLLQTGFLRLLNMVR